MNKTQIWIGMLSAIILVTSACSTKTDTRARTEAEAHSRIPANTELQAKPEAPSVGGGAKLFLDVHHFGPGKVTAKDVAGAHARDHAVQTKHDVRFVSYWFDEQTGTVQCLAEAPNAEAAIAVHREAHGLIPDSIAEVSEGH